MNPEALIRKINGWIEIKRLNIDKENGQKSACPTTLSTT